MTLLQISRSRVLGYFFILLSLIFLGDRAYPLITSQLNWDIGPYELTWIAVLSVFYGTSQYLLAFAWCSQLHRTLWDKQLSIDCILTYGRTQLGKYLPGNFAHFAARHISGINSGKKHPQLIYANSSEVLLLLFYSLFIWLALLSVSGAPPLITGLNNWTLAATLLPMGFITQWLIERFAIKNDYIKHTNNIWQLAISKNLAYFLFLVSAITSFCMLAYLFIPTLNNKLIVIIAASYMGAWALGYITPGVPGGIGVREALFVGFTSSLLGDFEAVRLALLSRLLTITGDTFLFIASSLISLLLLRPTPR